MGLNYVMATPKVIDGGVATSHILTHVDVGGLKTGESRSTVISANVLKEAAGVGHSDLINAHGISISTSMVGDHSPVLGVSLLKGGATDKPLESLNTRGREVFVGPSGVAEGYHHIAFKSSQQSAIHPLYNTEMSAEMIEMAKKRAGADWENESHETVHRNVFKSQASTADGKEETKYIVAAGGPVHKFVEKNLDNAKLPEFREYKNPKNSTIAPNNQPGFIMKEKDFDKVYNTLTTALKPVGPWEDGVTIKVTNLSGKTIPSDTHALVSTKFHRNPIDTERTSAPITFEDASKKPSAIHPTALTTPTVVPFEPEK